MPWMPGLVYKPGHNAGNLGNRKQNCRLHYTVGTDSTGIGLKGYFHFLVPKDGTPIQFAPTEAVCWDACEWNPQGYGIEIERLSDAEPLTDSQIHWVGEIARWANATDGIPLEFRDSPGNRVEPSTGFRGFITHRSLAEHKCDQHYDYISADDWNRAVGTVSTPDLAAFAAAIEAQKELSMGDVNAFQYANNLTTFFVDDAGNLVQSYYVPGAKDWATQVLAKGAAPGARPAVVRDWNGHQGRLDVFVPTADGKKKIQAYYEGVGASWSARTI